MEEKKNYLVFVAEIIEGKCQYKIINDKQEHIGRLEKVRVGAWQSWVLFLNENCYMSASCIDQTREKIRSLNSNKIVFL